MCGEVGSGLEYLYFRWSFGVDVEIASTEAGPECWTRSEASCDILRRTDRVEYLGVSKPS